MMTLVDNLLARIAELEHIIQVLHKQIEEQDEEIAGLMAELGYDEDDE
jgi:hypothetical protein